jgi:hypothetical protein
LGSQLALRHKCPIKQLFFLLVNIRLQPAATVDKQEYDLLCIRTGKLPVVSQQANEKHVLKNAIIFPAPFAPTLA